MADESIYDLIVDELLERQNWVKEELTNRFKKTKPFRQEPVSNKEALLDYDNFTPEREARMRQSFGDEIVDNYKLKMSKIQNRYKGVSGNA